MFDKVRSTGSHEKCPGVLVGAAVLVGFFGGDEVVAVAYVARVEFRVLEGRKGRVLL